MGTVKTFPKVQPGHFGGGEGGLGAACLQIKAALSSYPTSPSRGDPQILDVQREGSCPRLDAITSCFKN